MLHHLLKSSIDTEVSDLLFRKAFLPMDCKLSRANDMDCRLEVLYLDVLQQKAESPISTNEDGNDKDVIPTQFSKACESIFVIPVLNDTVCRL